MGLLSSIKGKLTSGSSSSSSSGGGSWFSKAKEAVSGVTSSVAKRFSRPKAETPILEEEPSTIPEADILETEGYEEESPVIGVKGFLGGPIGSDQAPAPPELETPIPGFALTEAAASSGTGTGARGDAGVGGGGEYDAGGGDDVGGGGGVPFPMPPTDDVQFSDEPDPGPPPGPPKGPLSGPPHPPSAAPFGGSIHDWAKGKWQARQKRREWEKQQEKQFYTKYTEDWAKAYPHLTAKVVMEKDKLTGRWIPKVEKGPELPHHYKKEWTKSAKSASDLNFKVQLEAKRLGVSPYKEVRVRKLMPQARETSSGRKISAWVEEVEHHPKTTQELLAEVYAAKRLRDEIQTYQTAEMRRRVSLPLSVLGEIADTAITSGERISTTPLGRAVGTARVRGGVTPTGVRLSAVTLPSRELGENVPMGKRFPPGMASLRPLTRVPKDLASPKLNLRRPSSPVFKQEPGMPPKMSLFLKHPLTNLPKKRRLF